MHRIRSRHATQGGRQDGFTLVELATVLGVIGLLAVAMTSSFDGLQQARAHNGARADAESARQALRAFALRNKRLPCPDTSTHGDSGREGAGVACGAGVDVGWLPYESLGLAIPVRASRLRYGVYRGAAATDLVAPRHGAADSIDIDGLGGFSTALTGAASAVASSARPYYVTGRSVENSCDAGSSPGTGITLINPAFVLVAPATDRDGMGSLHAGFDGIHQAFAAGASKCVASPDQPQASGNDDVVVAESPTALLGWLTATTR